MSANTSSTSNCCGKPMDQSEADLKALERVSRILASAADYMKTVRIARELDRDNREISEQMKFAGTQHEDTKKPLLERLRMHWRRARLLLSGPISIICILDIIKSQKNEKVSSLCTWKGLSTEPPVWWTHSRRRFFSCTVLAQKFWPCSSIKRSQPKSPAITAENFQSIILVDHVVPKALAKPKKKVPVRKRKKKIPVSKEKIKISNKRKHIRSLLGL